MCIKIGEGDEDLREPRIFVEWANGTYVSSLSEEFHKTVRTHVLELGPPVKVEYREWGWIVGDSV